MNSIQSAKSQKSNEQTPRRNFRRILPMSSQEDSQQFSLKIPTSKSKKRAHIVTSDSEYEVARNSMETSSKVKRNLSRSLDKLKNSLVDVSKFIENAGESSENDTVWPFNNIR